MDENKQKILLVSFKIIYPLKSGGAIAQYYFISEMIEKYDVTYCTIVYNPYQKKCIDELMKSFPNLNVKFLDLDNFSEQDNIPIIKIFRRLNRKVAHILRGGKIAKNSSIGFNSNIIDERFIIFFQDLLKRSYFDIIQLEFYETLSLLTIIPKSVKKIFVHHEIRSKRNEFINLQSPYNNYLNEVLRLNELSLLELANVVVVFNKEDEEYLESIKTPIQISPFGIPDKLIFKYNASKHFYKFLFIGNENHYPNKEGLSWFLDEVYLPDIEIIQFPIFITGEWTSEFKAKYRDYRNINFLGFLDSLENVFDGAVMVAPIISGSGIRTKILQAFANSVPVISTKFASEGLCDLNSINDHILHFKDSLDFSNIMSASYNKAGYFTETAVKGNDYYIKNFNTSDLIAKRFHLYQN